MGTQEKETKALPASTTTATLRLSAKPATVEAAAHGATAPPVPLEGERPPWVKPRIIHAPKLRQVYWCDFWRDARLPEMWKTRPVIVMSYKNSLHGPCLVIPISTEPQTGNKWAHLLSERLDGTDDNWAICNHPSTVSPSRFSQFRGKIPKISESDFNNILDLLRKWLPNPSLEKEA